MFDIKDFLQKLSSYNQIDFRGKEDELGLLAQKYDKNKNSIFEKDELEEIKKDVKYYGELNGNNDKLSVPEAIAYYDSLLPEGLVEFQNKNPYVDPSKNMNKLLSELTETAEKSKLIQDKLKELEGKREFSDEDFKALISIKDIYNLKRVIKYLYIEERGEEQFSCQDLVEFSKMFYGELEFAERWFYVEGREKQFNGKDIQCLGRGGRHPEDYIQRIDELVLINEFDGEIIYALANSRSFSEENIRRAKFLKKTGRFNSKDIGYLLDIPQKQYERAETLFQIENRKEQFDGWEIDKLTNLNDEQFERAKTLVYIENRENQFNGLEIKTLAELKDEQFDRAKMLVYIENRENQFNGLEIKTLAELKDEQFDRAKTLVYIQNREKQFDGSDIAELLQLTEDEYQWAEENLFQLNLSGNMCASIARWHSNDILKFVQNDDITVYSVKDSKNGITFADKIGHSYYFDKTGLVKSVEKIPTTDEIRQGEKTTTFDKKLNIKQEVVTGLPISDDFYRVVFSEVLTYYDEQGNIIKTVNLKRNPQNGFLNVSETDKNGETIPIQSQIYDPNTGAEITERCLTSPEGITTDYYAEISDNLKITNYKILDNGGKALIDIMQTFEQISDNKFISSINTTGNPEDTQVYEMTYTAFGRVKIYDKKNNKTTKINLRKSFIDPDSSWYERKIPNIDDMEKLMPTIKQLPGQVLLTLEENPILFDMIDISEKYNKTYGYYNGETIAVGNYDNFIGKEDNILATLLHEWGHYMDLNDDYNNPKFATNSKVLDTYNKELKELKQSATKEQQKYIDFFINGYTINMHTNTIDPNTPHKEKIAETYSILYSQDCPMLNMRRFYLAQYFPRTIAAIMKLLLEEEGITVNQ